MNGPDISVRSRPFNECWKELVGLQERLEWQEECKECEYQKSCARCAALFNIEGGKLKIRNEYCRKRKE